MNDAPAAVNGIATSGDGLRSRTEGPSYLYPLACTRYIPIFKSVNTERWRFEPISHCTEVRLIAPVVRTIRRIRVTGIVHRSFRLPIVRLDNGVSICSLLQGWELFLDLRLHSRALSSVCFLDNFYRYIQL